MDSLPSGAARHTPGRRRADLPPGRDSRWHRLALVLLVSLTVLVSGATPPDWRSTVDSVIAPHRFSPVGWHVRQFAELLKPVTTPPEALSDPADFVIGYYVRLTVARSLEETPAGTPPEEQAFLQATRPIVERILAAQVREAYRERGVYSPLDRLLPLPVTFPPVWFALEPPPHLLVISPRTEIASLRQELLVQTMDLATMEAIEREVEALDLSALVTHIGGLGATYPAIVSDDNSLRYTIETVAEEWLHQYLTFTPLGWDYVLHLLNIRPDYSIAQINESLAGVVTDEIGDAVWERYYAPRLPAVDPAPAEPDSFDYRAFMRETRVQAEVLLAKGQVEDAEAWMESRRQVLVAEDYRIRKLNQAYFAFHGTYADAPGSVTPVGDQLRALRAASGSLSDYMNTVVRIRSQQDLLDLLEQRSLGTAQQAPVPSP